MCQGLSNRKASAEKGGVSQVKGAASAKVLRWDCAFCVPGTARRIPGLVMGSKDNDVRRHER